MITKRFQQCLTDSISEDRNVPRTFSKAGSVYCTRRTTLNDGTNLQIGAFLNWHEFPKIDSLYVHSLL